MSNIENANFTFSYELHETFKCIFNSKWKYVIKQLSSSQHWILYQSLNFCMVKQLSFTPNHILAH